jgi:hypothetical protein
VSHSTLHGALYIVGERGGPGGGGEGALWSMLYFLFGNVGTNDGAAV